MSVAEYMAVLSGFKKANSPADESGEPPSIEEHKARVAEYQEMERRKAERD